MPPPPPPAATAAEALCCTADDQRSTNSEPETPRPTTSNGRQQVSDPTSPRPKAQSSQAQQPTWQTSRPSGYHESEDSPCLDPSLSTQEPDAIAGIFAHAESSIELESALTNLTQDLETTESLSTERAPKKQKRTAGRATSMLFLRHHMRGAEAEGSEGPASKTNGGADEAISGDDATRAGRSKEKGKAWSKVKRLTRDLSRSSMNLLMLKKAGDETDREENDKHKKKRTKLKKECSTSGSGSGPALSGADSADGAGTELHVLVETLVEVSVEPNTDVVDTGHHTNPVARILEDGKQDNVGPTALDYLYDSDASSLPEIRDSVVDRITRASTQEESQKEENQSLLEKERTSAEIKALIRESPGKGESKFSINPFELALPRSLTFSDLRDRLSGVRLSFSAESRPSVDLSADACPDTAFLHQAMKTHKVKESVAPVVRQGMAAEIENAWNEYETPSSPKTASRSHEDIFRKENTQKVGGSSVSSRIGSFPSPQVDVGFGYYPASNPDSTNTVQPPPFHGKMQQSLLQLPKNVQRDGDAASVHLHHMHISQHLRSDSSLSSTTDLHKSIQDVGEKTGPASDNSVHGTTKNYYLEGQNGKRDREANAYPFRRLAHHNASSATNLQLPKPFAMIEDHHQHPHSNHDGPSSQAQLDVGLGTRMFPDLRDIVHIPPPPPIPPSRVRGDRRTSTSSSTNASAQTGFHSSRVPPTWGHVLSSLPTQTNTTAVHSRQASGGNASRYAGSSVYSSRNGAAMSSAIGFGANAGLGTTSAAGKAYEPSSVYSTRANSPSLCGSLGGSGTGSGTPQPSVFSGVAESGSGTGSQSGSGGGMKKSGYEVFEMPKDLDESPDEGNYEQTVIEGANNDSNGMPGAYPTTPGPFDSVEADRKAAGQLDEAIDADEKEQKPERRSTSPSEDSIYETPDTTAVELQNSSPEIALLPTAIMIQCPQSPPEGEQTPLQPKRVKKNRSAMNLLGLQNALKPSLEHHESRRRSVGAKLSGFNIFRSKTMSNLRRASQANIMANESKEDAGKTSLAQHEDKDEESEVTETKELAVDGPTDRRGSAGTQALRHGVERHDRGHDRDDYDDNDEHNHHHHQQHHHQRDSVARDINPVPLEERKLGRLSRALAFRDSLTPVSGSANQAAMWEKALQAHREEKSALFLSPEKGGKAKAQSLFRERSGSGSALRAKAIDENESGQKRPRSAEPTSDAWMGFAGFGEKGESSKTGAEAGRSDTFMLDPLDPGFRNSRAALQPPTSGIRESSGLLGNKLKHGHIPESASISPCASPAPPTEETRFISQTRSWDEAEVSAMNLGDLGAWSRYPSHTRDTRNTSAGLADDVRTRDFAYEIQLAEIAESDDGGETGTGNKKTSRSPKSNKRGGTLGSSSFKRRGKNKSRGGLPKSKSMTFGRNFLKHYIGLFRSQSEEFRRHGHGHRSSVAEGGILEHPELEILPPVWSPVSIVLDPPPRENAEGGHGTRGGDGAGDEREQDMAEKQEPTEGSISQGQGKGKQRLEDGHKVSDKEVGNAAKDSSLDSSAKKPDFKVEFELPETSNQRFRIERNTGSSEASWKADARLWSKLCSSDNMSPLMTSKESLVEERVDREPPIDRKAERSSEWQRNVRLWTRFADPSQEFNAAVPHEAERSYLIHSDFDPNDTVDLENHIQGSSEYADRPTSPPPRTSDEWRRDARLFSQIYESCVGLPQFGSAEDINGNGTSNKTISDGRHHHTGLRVSSAGIIDSLVMGRENTHPAGAAKWRTLSGGEAGTCGGHFKNGSQASMASLKRSTWDMMKVLD